jgi:hypothetical protein
MRKAYLVVGTILALAITVGEVRAQSDNVTIMPIRQTMSGTIVRHSDVTANPAYLGICAGTGTLGDYTCNTLWVLIPPPSDWTPPAACPPPAVFPFFFKGGHTQRFQNGDLLYWKQDQTSPNNYLCWVSQTRAIGHLEYRFDGGTGRFEGAKGKVTMQGHFDVVSSDSVGTLLMGGTGTVTGTLELAR